MRIVKTSQAPTRGRYHHGDLRNALLEKALELVAARGQEGFSLREAARAVGVSATAAYRHFADKTAILTALAKEGHARLASAMERAAAKVPGPAGGKAHAIGKLRAIGEVYVEFAVKNPSHFRVMFSPCMQNEGFGPDDPTDADAFQILVETLDELVVAGAVRAEARAGAEIIAWSAVHGLAGLLVEGALPLSARERAVAIAMVTRAVLLSLGSDPALVPAPAVVVSGDPRAGGKVRPARAVP